MTSRSSRIDPHAAALLFQVAETPRATVAGQVLTRYHRSAGKQLLAAGLLSRLGDEAVAVSMTDYEDEPVRLGPGIEDGSFGYFSPTAGWISPGGKDLAVYGICFKAILPRLAAALDCQLASSPVELTPGLVWDLGHARLPGRPARVSIWVARRLPDPDAWASFSALARRRPAAPVRAVLSFALERSLPERTLPGHEIVAITSVLDHEDGLEVDANLLSARLQHGRADDAPVTMAADGGLVTVRGKQYRFTGSKQRSIIRQLVEAWQAGRPQCVTAAVLENAEYSASVNTLAKAFSGRTDWRDFIREKNGFCWIEL